MLASVHNSIAEIDAAEWDGLVGPGRLFQSHAWLEVLEGGSVLDYVPKYVVIRDDAGELIAAAAAFIMPTSLITLSSGSIRTLVDGIQRAMPGFLRPRILECGSPLGPGNGICVRSDIAMSDVAPILCEAFDQIASREGLHFIVLRDLLESELAGATAFERFGYARSEGFPTMSLALNWPSYDRYLQAMTSRHRQKVRRGLSLAQKSNLEVRWTGNAGTHAEQLASERENVRSLASEYCRERLGPLFFERLDRIFGPRVKVLDVLKEGQRVGHAVVVDDGSVLRWLSFGRSAAGTRDGAYFLVIAKIVEFALRENWTSLDMGITTPGPKSDFGAEIVRQWMLVRLRGPLGVLLPLALRLVGQSRRDVARRVFKDNSL